MTTVKVKRHKRQKPKPPTQHQRDLQKVVELELPMRRRAAMMQGIQEREERLRALKRAQLDAGITRMKGNLASVPVPHVATFENAIAQLQRDLNELARKYLTSINEAQTNIPRIGQCNIILNEVGSGRATPRALQRQCYGDQ